MNIDEWSFPSAWSRVRDSSLDGTYYSSSVFENTLWWYVYPSERRDVIAAGTDSKANLTVSQEGKGIWKDHIDAIYESVTSDTASRLGKQGIITVWVYRDIKGKTAEEAKTKVDINVTEYIRDCIAWVSTLPPIDDDGK